MSVYIVLLNWNGWRDTLACVRSLRSDTTADAKIVVCDNGSTDGSLRALSEGLSQLTGDAVTPLQSARAVPDNKSIWLLDNGANLGFAAGNNFGIRFALRDPQCTHVWILNNDTEVQPGALREALAEMSRRPELGLCGSTLVYHHDHKTVQAFGGSRYKPLSGCTAHIGYGCSIDDIPASNRDVEAQMDCVVGAAMLASRAFLETVGLMAEDYFLYYEEMDWAARAKGRYRLGYAPQSVVFHKEGASIGTAADGGSPMSTYYLFRSRLRFVVRHQWWMLPLVIAHVGWDLFKLTAKRRWVHARSALFGALQLRAPGRQVRPSGAAVS